MNPFIELSTVIPPGIMKSYVVLMVLLVIGGTLLDIMHKKSAQYFFEKGQALKRLAKRELGAGERVKIAIATLLEILVSGEFDNPDRRKSHLLLMYGFIVFVITTALLIFNLPHKSSFLTGLLWHVGALAICVGGYWFWLKIRVDVRSEGHKWYDIHFADLFIVSLLMTATFALAWSILQGIGLDTLGWVAFSIFIASATTLFGTVFWSKFAHMFYKPAAAFQKKLVMADGSMDKLPEIPEDLSSPWVKERYPDIPKYMGDNPPYMGLGIKREPPTHF